MNTLVIDVGTSSMRGIVFDDRGERIARSRCEYRPTYGDNGVAEQPAESFLLAFRSNVANVVKETTERGSSIDLLAVTSQRSSITAIDEKGEALLPFIMWQDARNQSLVERLAESNDVIFERSGTLVNTVFSGAKMAWIESELPDVAAHARRYATIPELLIHEACGVWAIDQTYASRSNLMNIRRLDWDDELLGIFGVPRDKLSPICRPGTMIGSVTPEFAAATGLAAGIPVVSSGGDQQCGSVGQGIVEPGEVSVVCGTGAFVQTLVKEVPDNLEPAVICNASSLDGLYTFEASVPTCCSAFDWFRREFCPDLSFEQIGEIVEQKHGLCDPLVFLPYFQGRGTPNWDSEAKAAVCGITLSTSRGDLLYSLLAGVFAEVGENLDNLSRYVGIDKGVISGGLTQTSSINQLQADMYGIPLSCSNDPESTALGALVVALAGQGIADPKETLALFSSTDGETVYQPNREKHAALQGLKLRNNELYRSLKTARTNK